MHFPCRRCLGAHCWSKPGVLPILLCLLPVLALAACGKKGRGKAPSREPMTWSGLALGMPADKAKDRLKALGTTLTCQEARTVMFLDGGTLVTQWVKAGSRGSTERCDAMNAAARDKSKDELRGLLRAKLFFLEGRLRQFNVILSGSDSELAKELDRRWGPPEQVAMAVRLYSGKKEGSIRVFQYKNKEHTVLWLRKAQLQELIFLPHQPEAVTPLQQIGSPTKD